VGKEIFALKGGHQEKLQADSVPATLGCNGLQLHLSRSLLSMVCGHRMNALVKLISFILFVGAGCFLLFGGLLGFLGLIPAILALAVMVTAIFMSRSVSGKRCPQCAETVKTEAVVCRYCGHKFTSPEQLPPDS
jgi:hypothetical protein